MKIFIGTIAMNILLRESLQIQACWGPNFSMREYMKSGDEEVVTYEPKKEATREIGRK